MRVIIGQDKGVATWVSLGLFKNSNSFDLATTRAIGISNNNKLICGVVYNNLQTDVNDKPYSIEMTIYSIDKTWCTKYNLSVLFAYPFSQYNLKRVQATTREDNGHVRAFLERLGFKLCGIARMGHPDLCNAAVYDMLKHECRWIRNGKKNSKGPRSSRNS